MSSSANQGSSRLLVEVRSARPSNSTTLPSQPKSGSSEAPKEPQYVPNHVGRTRFQ